MDTEVDTRTPRSTEQMLADKAAYDWLKRELSQYCDRVLEQHDNYGLDYAIACEWVRGKQRLRWAVHVEQHSRDFSLNQDIEGAHISRDEVVRLFTKRRPVWR